MSDTESDTEEIMEEIMENIEPEVVKDLERVRVHYTESQLEDIEGDKIVFTHNLKKCMKKIGQRFYENHFDVSHRVVATFENGKIVYQLVVALTQSGKTSAMSKTIEMYMERNLIPIENIYLITGLSSVDWKEQTKKRFPECMHPRIFHNGNLKDFKTHIENKQNCLILIDEAQVACKMNQTLGKIMTALGWSTDFLLESDIKIVQFSATPDGILYAYDKWPTKDHYTIHYMETGEHYFGTKEMIARKQLKQYKKISFEEDDYDEAVIYLEEIVADIVSFERPRYHVIRPQSRKYKEIYIEKIQQIIEEDYPEKASEFCFDSSSYSMDGDIEDLDALLTLPPEKHRFIFIKEKLKCADTIEKKNIGVMIERCTPNDSFKNQALAGRGCGYGEHDMIIYTDLESIKRYNKIIECIKTGVSFDHIQWISNSTKCIHGKTIPKSTYNVGEKTTNISIPMRCEFNFEADVLLNFIQTGKDATHLLPDNIKNMLRICIHDRSNGLDKQLFSNILHSEIEKGTITISDPTGKFNDNYTLKSFRRIRGETTNYRIDKYAEYHEQKKCNYINDRASVQENEIDLLCCLTPSKDRNGRIHPVNVFWIVYRFP